jgi:adenylate kinase
MLATEAPVRILNTGFDSCLASCMCGGVGVGRTTLFSIKKTLDKLNELSFNFNDTMVHRAGYFNRLSLKQQLKGKILKKGRTKLSVFATYKMSH